MSVIETLFGVYLSTGVAVGFGHCIGMCGPIVVSLSLGLAGRSPWGPHLLYNTGRILTYALLGGILGATGAFARLAAGIAGFQKGVLIFAGILIIAMGVVTGGWLPKGSRFEGVHPSGSWFAKGFAKISRTRKTAAYFPLGLLLGLLPCGPVYTALIGAARIGMETRHALFGMVSGMGMMTAFGLGTVLPLLLVARLTSMGWLKSRVWFYRLSSMIMVGMGLYFLINAFRY
jgi:sulfite exporter TauE/SafE